MKEDVLKALEVLKRGGIILYPTDTIWGIGCDATNPEAVSRIYKIKQRDDSKSMLVLLDNQNRLTSYVDEIPEVAWELIKVADKPLTIIYPVAKNLAGNLIAEDGSVGIRITMDSFCGELIGRFRRPIVSTSANITNRTAPANFFEISEEIKNSVDYIVKWRQKERKKYAPSSIIMIDNGGRIKVIR